MNYIGYSRYDEPAAYSDLHNDAIADQQAEARASLRKIFDIVYGDKDVEDLEYELEQLAWQFGMKLPSKPFTLSRTKGE